MGSTYNGRHIHRSHDGAIVLDNHDHGRLYVVKHGRSHGESKSMPFCQFNQFILFASVDGWSSVATVVAAFAVGGGKEIGQSVFVRRVPIESVLRDTSRSKFVFLAYQTPIAEDYFATASELRGKDAERLHYFFNVHGGRVQR